MKNVVFYSVCASVAGSSFKESKLYNRSKPSCFIVFFRLLRSVQNYHTLHPNHRKQRVLQCFPDIGRLFGEANLAFKVLIWSPFGTPGLDLDPI